MSVSLCAIRLELGGDSIVPKDLTYLAPQYRLAMASSKENSDPKERLPEAETWERDRAGKCRGKRELHTIEMETYENDNTETGPWEISKGKNRKSASGTANKITASSKSSSFDQELPSTSKEASPALSSGIGDVELAVSETSNLELVDRKKGVRDQINFFSGNPFVEKVQGILHFYKENHMTSLEMDVPRSQMICLLAIPAWLSCHDLLNFLAPCCPGIRRVRIIRDKTPNQYMALVLFRSQEEADECYKTFNGTPYNSIESELCHLVYVAQVEICGDTTVGGSGGFGPPMTGMTELPICTVCLERMDESVDGILTILCNHSFHGACLAKWGDTTCPVCRYLQSPEMAAESCCSECKSNESLWICLICGHVGCGRYVEGHAYHHFLETQHCYAMQLGNTRVWDYVGDNFVHRLLQNNEDGKLVEVEGNSNGRRLHSGKGDNIEHEEKLDSVQLEYLYLLQSQLASQKIHFESIIDRLEQQHRQEREEIKEKVKTTIKENERLKMKEKKTAAKLSKAVADLQEEKELNRSLVANQSTWHQRVSQLEIQVQKIREEKETSIRDLQEQLQDVMLYFDAQEKFKNTELEGGQVVLGMPSSPSRSDGSKGARNKKRGGK